MVFCFASKIAFFSTCWEQAHPAGLVDLISILQNFLIFTKTF